MSLRSAVGGEAIANLLWISIRKHRFIIVKKHDYAVYILTNKNNRVLYVGVTSELVGRVYDHKHKKYKGFTSRYSCTKLGYFEEFQWIHDAIDREKQLKAGSRQKKVDLIISMNPLWADLSDGWYE